MHRYRPILCLCLLGILMVTTAARPTRQRSNERTRTKTEPLSFAQRFKAAIEGIEKGEERGVTMINLQREMQERADQLKVRAERALADRERRGDERKSRVERDFDWYQGMSEILGELAKRKRALEQVKYRSPRLPPVDTDSINREYKYHTKKFSELCAVSPLKEQPTRRTRRR
jgi:hypothetical protein